MRFPEAIERDPAIEAWLREQRPELAAIARRWFAQMRECGREVRELMHDGCPTACVGDAAFAYVGVYRAHANVGFFHGAGLEDPRGLLEGTGKDMRHVKIRPGVEVDSAGLAALIRHAYADIKVRLEAERGAPLAQASSVPTSIDEYIAAAAPTARPLLEEIRRLVRAAAPQAEELISYRMPAFRQHGILIYFAAFKQHIGVFPPVSGDTKLVQALAPYAGPKGNLKFPIERKLPSVLIRRIVKLRLEQNLARASAKPSGARRRARPTGTRAGSSAPAGRRSATSARGPAGRRSGPGA